MVTTTKRSETKRPAVDCSQLGQAGDPLTDCLLAGVALLLVLALGIGGWL